MRKVALQQWLAELDNKFNLLTKEVQTLRESVRYVERFTKVDTQILNADLEPEQYGRQFSQTGLRGSETVSRVLYFLLDYLGLAVAETTVNGNKLVYLVEDDDGGKD